LIKSIIMKPIILYRSLLKNAKKIEQYNFKSFAIRKVKEDFYKSKGLVGDDAGIILIISL